MAGLRGLDPSFYPSAQALVDACGLAGLLPRVTSALRTYSQQKRLYERFLAGTAHYPVAPPGHSAHELGLAFDMVVVPMDSIRDVGELWESWGGRWGGRFGDEIHFEAPWAKQEIASKGILYRTLTTAASLFVDPEVSIPLTAAKYITPGLYRSLRDYSESLIGEPATEVLEDIGTLF